jgi:hypothetical protein
MKNRLRGCTWVLVLLLAVSAAAQPAPKQRILFIGNSYTYFNNLPAVLGHLVNSAQPDTLETSMVVQGGATLQVLWDKGEALNAIQQGHWTYVVLQEQSTLGPGPTENGVPQINDPSRFFEYARRFDAEIKKSGAKTVFFLTWARQDSPQNQAKLTAAYTRIAQELGAILVPVGTAWQAALHDRPALALHQLDKSHPTSAGTYLAACVFYATLFRRDPTGLPARVVGKPVAMDGRVLEAESHGVFSSPSSVELINLAPDVARFLQTIAARSYEREAQAH